MCTWAKIVKSYFSQYRHSWVIIGLSQYGRIPLILRCFHCARNICLQMTSYFFIIPSLWISYYVPQSCSSPVPLYLPLTLIVYPHKKIRTNNFFKKEKHFAPSSFRPLHHFFIHLRGIGSCTVLRIIHSCVFQQHYLQTITVLLNCDY